MLQQLSTVSKLLQRGVKRSYDYVDVGSSEIPRNNRAGCEDLRSAKISTVTQDAQDVFKYDFPTLVQSFSIIDLAQELVLYHK